MSKAICQQGDHPPAETMNLFPDASWFSIAKIWACATSRTSTQLTLLTRALSFGTPMNKTAKNMNRLLLMSLGFLAS